MRNQSKPRLRIDILCLFPKSLARFFSYGLISKASKEGLLQIKLHNLRNWATDRRRSVDDRPYGGGAGMVLAAGPLTAAVKQIENQARHKPYVILTSPGGGQFTQVKALKLLKKKHLLIVCGRYEGVDERFIKGCVDEEISIGDYILAGGEAAALVIVETLSRLVPGTLGNRNSLSEESFSRGLLEYPQYTRPEVWQGKKIPPILLSGDHEKIRKWRLRKSLEKTRKVRPDLLTRRDYSYPSSSGPSVVHKYLVS